jgi:hypothetical protein
VKCLLLLDKLIPTILIKSISITKIKIMKMKNQILSKLSIMAFLMAAVAASFMGCDDDDDNQPTLTGETKTYSLASVSNPAISGTIKFAERSDHATVVTIDLNGTTSGNTHPAHIHANSAAQTGGIIIDLNSVNGETGISETIVTKKNDGTAISYDQLLDLDGYANVHLSAANLATLIAQGDIGENELTATSKTYTLSSVNESGITGTITFTKRVNDSTLVKVDLDGASAAGEYPVYIYANDVITTGPIAIDLNPVSGSTGISYTNVTRLNNGTAITYQQLTEYDGHIGVNTSPLDPAFLAQVNIGSNP